MTWLRYEDLKDMKEKYDEVARNTILWNRYKILQQGMEDSQTIVKTDKGGFFEDPSVIKSDGKPLPGR